MINKDTALISSIACTVIAMDCIEDELKELTVKLSQDIMSGELKEEDLISTFFTLNELLFGSPKYTEQRQKRAKEGSMTITVEDFFLKLEE